MTEQPTAEELAAEQAAGSDGEGEGTQPKEGAEQEGQEEQKIEIPDNIPTRSNLAASHIIARKNRQIEKLKQKQEQGDGGDRGDDGGQESEDEKIDPATKAIVDHLAKMEAEAEIKQLVSEKPEAKKYEAVIRKYMEHPAYSQVPAEMIYSYLTRNQTAADKIEKAKEVADSEAEQLKGAGTSHRPKSAGTNTLPTAEQLSKMTDAEIAAMADEVMMSG